MCITSEQLAFSPGATTCDKSPKLTFKDPRNNVQNEFVVGLLTPLDTPECLSSFLRTQYDAWEPRQKPPEVLKPDLEGCANKDYFLRGCVDQMRNDIPCFVDKSVCYGQAMFAKVFKYWYFSGVRRCDNATCKARKRALEISAPDCRWTTFRDAVLTSIACWQPWEEVMSFNRTVPTPDQNIQVPAFFCIDVLGMINLWLWTTRLLSGAVVAKLVEELDMKGYYDTRFHQLWQGLSMDHNIRAVESSRKFHEHGFCVNRLWNVSLQSRHGTADIPYIVEKALEAPVPKSKERHINCTEEHCLIVHENSTLVKQAHKCTSGACNNDLTFSSDILNQAFSHLGHTSNSFVTSWRILGPGQQASLCTPGDNYMALSHVWSDGTGVGMRSAGCVNACLYEYFAEIARRPEISCDGIWWDAISIPTDRDAKAAAMDRMLENYENAKVTVVHDQELVEFEWKDDGSPAIAMVLSTWFTRGWTAAELWASRDHPVKVLFKDPNDPTGKRPLIKDLDMDILAGDLSRWVSPESDGSMSPFNTRALDPTQKLPELAHMIATDILGLFRWTEDQKVPDLQSLLRMLQTRTTSWARDRMLISALMCLPRDAVDSTTTGPQMTQMILANFGSLRTTEIINHRVPIIFDLGQWSLSSDPMGDWSYISDDGSIKCEFLAYEVSAKDVITEYRQHPALAARISVALSRRQNCLLLTTPRIREEISTWTVIGRWIGRHLQVWNTHPDGTNIVGISPPTYVLGKNRSSVGKPLPTLSFDSVFLALGASRRNRLPPAESWCLSTTKPEELSNLPTQPVYVYNLSAGQVPNIGRGGPAHPCGRMSFDLTAADNWIYPSFLSGLTESLALKKVSGCSDSHERCGGIVSVSWSFPCSENDYYACWDIVPKVYTSVFHVISKVDPARGDCEMTLGLSTFNAEIEKSLFQDKKYGKDSTYIKTCVPCGKCAQCVRR
ncbi:hypothetical protein F4677DRAFT_464491 [Hypoxylon crocopeplum]|nr:hypothetical protein F4677DRAFT_464491 [Hypoxylon crocopeplum]